jgi:hypothetical protein
MVSKPVLRMTFGIREASCNLMEEIAHLETIYIIIAWLDQLYVRKKCLALLFIAYWKGVLSQY